jgi:hypothetical protein
MAVTITLLADEQNVSLGPVPVSFVTLAPDASYPTGGYGTSLGVSAANLYCGRGINGIIQMGNNTAGAGYILEWNSQTSKIQIFESPAITPAGTLSGNVVITGSGIGQAIGVNPDSNSGVISKASAGNDTIPYATFLGGALTFTGTAGSKAALAEVTNGTNLSTLTFNIFVVGQR